MSNVNRDNFYIASKGNWQRANTPERKPDYTSYFKGKVSSEYWFSKNGVTRRSDHWGEVAACIWLLDGQSLQLVRPESGEIAWEKISWRTVKGNPELMVELFNRFNGNELAMEQIKKQLR